jgi:hypothetical protein
MRMKQDDHIEENHVCSGSTAESEEDGAGAGNKDGNEEQQQEQEENETANNETQTPDIANILSPLLTPDRAETSRNEEQSLVDKAIQFFDDTGIVNRKRNDLPEDRTVLSLFRSQLENCNVRGQ